jgi:NADH-quinone oxidoreductase subunit H
MPISISYILAYTFLVLLCVLLSVAYFTLLDRNQMASMQRRRGPNVVGYFGLLQPLADGAKLLLKEAIIPLNANKLIFLLAPLLTFTLSLVI